MSYSAEKNRYWIPNYDISQRVITQEIQWYLGPESTVRPYTLEGEQGYLISTPGECLTDAQIDDICLKSKEIWEKRAAAAAAQSKKDSDMLKRPLHKPVVVFRSSKSSSPTTSSRHHHHHHNDDRNRGEGPSHRRSNERRYDERDRW